MPLNPLPSGNRQDPQPLFEWMQERELIRQRRATGAPPPWTQDKILRDGHFTNVMREYDRVSVWIHENIIRTPRCTPGLLPLQLAVARWINNTETLELLINEGVMPVYGFKRELVTIADFLWERQQQGLRVWGNGYVISAAGMQHAEYRSKLHYALVGCVGEMLDIDPLPGTIQGVTEALAKLPGWGGFMAYEVACDMRWSKDHLFNAPDIYTWANPGPGAVRGLKGLGYRAGKHSIQDMRDILWDASAGLWAVQWPRALEMRDIEHSLCEWGKYRKMELGAPPRRYYRPYAGPLSHRV